MPRYEGSPVRKGGEDVTSPARSRVEKGVPSGGQFAADPRDEVDVDLSTTSGEVPVRQLDPVLVTDPCDPPPHLSFSATRQYEFCPAQYAQARVLRLDSEHHAGVDARDAGTIAHEVLDRVAKGESRDAALDATLDGTADPEVRQLATKAVDDATAWEATDPNRVNLMDTEVDVEGEIAGYRIVGTADCIEWDNDGVAVADYKTGKAPSPVGESSTGGPLYAPAVTRQGVMYALLFAQRGLHVNRVRMHYTAHRKTVDVNLDDDRGQLLRKEAENYVAFLGEQIDRSSANGRWKAKPSQKKCEGCDFAGQCPFSKAVSG